MKLVVKPYKFSSEYNKYDALLLPLKDYATDYDSYYSLDEIKNIKKVFSKEIFVVINRMFFNDEIDKLKDILLEIEKLNINGIFYYDLAVLQLKKELNLKTDLVWNATFMVTNYKTCNYYFEKGVKYAYISNEITEDEILEIKEKSKIIPMVTMIGYPTVATSRRSLVTNYEKNYNLDLTSELEIEEKVTHEKYIVNENVYGTTFKYGKVLNNTSSLSKFIESGIEYFICIEDKIDHEVFINVLDNINNCEIVNSLIGDNTGFLHKKTIYKVKKDG